MWSSRAFCRLVDISMPTPRLSIEHSGSKRSKKSFWYLAKPQTRSARWFSIFVDDQRTTATGAGGHYIGCLVL